MKIDLIFHHDYYVMCIYHTLMGTKLEWQNSSILTAVSFHSSLNQRSIIIWFTVIITKLNPRRKMIQAIFGHFSTSRSWRKWWCDDGNIKDLLDSYNKKRQPYPIVDSHVRLVADKNVCLHFHLSHNTSHLFSKFNGEMNKTTLNFLAKVKAKF